MLTYQNLFIHARSADIKPSAKRFTVLAYTGGVLPGALRDDHGNRMDAVLDLATLRQRSNLVANLDHHQLRRVGTVDEVVNDGRQLTLNGALSASTPWRDEVLDSYRDGYAWEASIEATFGDDAEVVFLQRGETRTVNHQLIRGPMPIAYHALLIGFAFVSHGADANTKVSIAASRQFRRPDFSGSPRIFSDRVSNQLANWATQGGK